MIKKNNAVNDSVASKPPMVTLLIHEDVKRSLFVKGTFAYK